MIQLKGKQAGMLLCIVPEEMDEETMLAGFDKMVKTSKKFLAGNKIVMDMQGRSFSLSLIEKIWERFIGPSECSVISWLVLDAASHELLKRAGVALGEPKVSLRNEKGSDSQVGLLFTGTLRGGQKIEHDGDVIVAGHVNTGSEISATGHVVVLGWLKGLVHAGCGGDNTMSVSARSFESGQVRIGDKVGLIDKSSRFWGNSAVVTVSSSEVLIADWPAI